MRLAPSFASVSIGFCSFSPRCRSRKAATPRPHLRASLLPRHLLHMRSSTPAWRRPFTASSPIADANLVASQRRQHRGLHQLQPTDGQPDRIWDAVGRSEDGYECGDGAPALDAPSNRRPLHEAPRPAQHGIRSWRPHLTSPDTLGGEGTGAVARGVSRLHSLTSSPPMEQGSVMQSAAGKAFGFA